jgi:sugar fermentation stimulation protein A
MKIAGPLFKGYFRERPNRFLTKVDLEGKIVSSHLPDPGRLKELLMPGAEVYLRKAPPGSSRKTPYTIVMVKKEGVLVSLVSALPNQFVQECLEQGQLLFLKNYKFVRREVPFKHHRFDFLLQDKEARPFYLEVKSVTFVKNGVAQFPDAVTDRGARHAHALGELAQQGKGAGILFVCQRPDARMFRPMWERDPKFGHALWKANQQGVQVWCITARVTEMEMTYSREIPVNLTPVKQKQSIHVPD